MLNEHFAQKDAVRFEAHQCPFHLRRMSETQINTNNDSKCCGRTNISTLACLCTNTNLTDRPHICLSKSNFVAFNTNAAVLKFQAERGGNTPSITVVLRVLHKFKQEMGGLGV